MSLIAKNATNTTQEEIIVGKNGAIKVYFDATDNASSNLIQGNVTLTGAADRLSADTACESITVQANPTNASFVYIGKSTVSASVHMAVLSPGSSMTFAVSNANLLYAFGTAGDKVSYGGEV